MVLLKYKRNHNCPIWNKVAHCLCTCISYGCERSSKSIHFCACHKPRPGFPTSYVVGFLYSMSFFIIWQILIQFMQDLNFRNISDRLKNDWYRNTSFWIKYLFFLLKNCELWELLLACSLANSFIYGFCPIL